MAVDKEKINTCGGGINVEKLTNNPPYFNNLQTYSSKMVI